MPINPVQTVSDQTNPSREQLLQDFLYELERSLLLEETEKDYWRNRAATMPLQILQNTCTLIKKKNQIVDKYISAALDEDPSGNYQKGLQELINKIKTDTYSIEQKSEQAEAEKFLESNLT